MENKLQYKYNELIETKTLHPKWLPLSSILIFIGVPFEEGLNSALRNQGFFKAIYEMLTDSSYYVMLAILLPLIIAFALFQREYIKTKYRFLIDSNQSVFERREKYKVIYQKQYDKIMNSKVFHNKDRNDRLIQSKLNRDDMIIKRQIFDLLVAGNNNEE